MNIDKCKLKILFILLLYIYIYILSCYFTYCLFIPCPCLNFWNHIFILQMKLTIYCYNIYFLNIYIYILGICFFNYKKKQDYDIMLFCNKFINFSLIFLLSFPIYDYRILKFVKRILVQFNYLYIISAISLPHIGKNSHSNLNRFSTISIVELSWICYN